MIKYPLFGQDSIPQKTSRFIALISTVVFWIIFLICSFTIKPLNKKPKYETVQIVLATTPEAKKTETAKAESPEKAPVPVQEVAPAPEPAKPAESQKKQEIAKTVTPKPAPKKTETPKPAAKAPAPQKSAPKPAPVQKSEPVQQTYARDYSDDFDFDSQTSVAKSTQNLNWDDMFGDDSDDSEAVNQTSKNVVKTDNSYEVSKTNSSDYSNNAVTSSTGKAVNNNQNTTKGTSSALESITNASASSNSGSVAKAGSDTSYNSDFTFKSGEARRLLDPASPSISISKENENLLYLNDVTVKFVITKEGTVLPGTIELSPSLPPAVLSEVSSQVSKWRFSTGSTNANAEFLWHIKRK